MKDVGEFTPKSEIGKIQDPMSKVIHPPRRATTDDQMHEVEVHARLHLASGESAVRFLVHWARRAPSVVIVHGHHERIGAPRNLTVGVVDRIEEQSIDGRPLIFTPEQRHEQLEAELIEDIGGESGP